ncbi:MAG: DUF436 family protein, partial [Thermoanaerobacterium sp.]|nr:DUF436 family protein [Thermoanaerobacterium sp.]
MDINEIKIETKEVIEELLDIADVKSGGLFVLGGSTSEVIGRKVGTSGSLDIAKAIVD